MQVSKMVTILVTVAVFAVVLGIVTAWAIAG
jgi:hypothetical protein